MKTNSQLALAVLLAAAPACAQDDAAGERATPAPRVRLVDAFPGQKPFDKPLWVTFHETDPDHAYVVEQDGIVWRVPRDGGDAPRQEFLNWKGKCLRKNWEEGLLDLAFDPDYAANELLYVYWSEEQPGGKRRSVISRLKKVDGFAGPVVDPDSELRLMEIDQPYGNHNGGTIVFGPDRMLYIALGDGGRANDPHGHGQNLGSLLGAVLRIDVRGATEQRPYRLPPDNPFVDRPDARGEIWAYGLRNPWRISFDRQTGDLWCADVGQNKWEEVDVLAKGGNYGWNLREGKHRFAPEKGPEPGGVRPPEGQVETIEPVLEYPRSDGWSITGGYVYRGEALPDLVGQYVYADFILPHLWAARVVDGEARITELMQPDQVPAQISSFAQEPDGELLICSFTGKIYRIVPAGE